MEDVAPLHALGSTARARPTLTVDAPPHLRRPWGAILAGWFPPGRSPVSAHVFQERGT